jgi:hypothetical protein
MILYFPRACRLPVHVFLQSHHVLATTTLCSTDTATKAWIPVGAGVVATSARLTEVCSMMHSADPVVALSEATSARAVVGAAVAEGCNWLGGGGGSGAHSAGGGAGGGDVEELDAEGLGHAARG